jgi:hypothetical protein
MQLFFYSCTDNAHKKRLEAAIYKVIPGKSVEFFETLDDLEERLHRIIEPGSLAVLFAINREELLRMQMLRELLPEIHVILVLPDRTESTIGLAHLLLPRFLTQKEDSFTDLQEVLDKMVRNSR